MKSDRGRRLSRFASGDLTTRISERHSRPRCSRRQIASEQRKTVRIRVKQRQRYRRPVRHDCVRHQDHFQRRFALRRDDFARSENAQGRLSPGCPCRACCCPRPSPMRHRRAAAPEGPRGGDRRVPRLRGDRPEPLRRRGADVVVGRDPGRHPGGRAPRRRVAETVPPPPSSSPGCSSSSAPPCGWAGSPASCRARCSGGSPSGLAIVIVARQLPALLGIDPGWQSRRG